MANSVDFRADLDKCTCLACDETFMVDDHNRFEVSPHLREKHGFVGEIRFICTSQVICPRMEFVTASEVHDG